MVSETDYEFWRKGGFSSETKYGNEVPLKKKGFAVSIPMTDNGYYIFESLDEARQAEDILSKLMEKEVSHGNMIKILEMNPIRFSKSRDKK